MSYLDILMSRGRQGTLFDQLAYRKMVGGGGGTLIGTDSEPYQYRRSPSLGAYTKERDEIVGGTVAWNQLAPNNYSCDSERTTAFDSGTTIVAGHKYYMSRKLSASQSVGNYVYAKPTDNTAQIVMFLAGSKTASILQASYGGVSTGSATSTDGNTWLYQSASAEGTVTDLQITDLTALLGTTIADHIYTLEQGTAGAGVAFFRKYFGKDYYPYSAPTIRSVEGLVSHTMRDENDNIIGEYPLDSTVTLRGILKLQDGKLKADGDVYKADGTVTRKYGTRAYQSGDESLADAITDGTTTVYKLTTPTTETATPYAKTQKCDPSGTEEYVTSSVVPVGHNTEYYG